VLWSATLTEVSRNVDKLNQTTGTPFLNSKKLNVNVARMSSRFVFVHHCNCRLVVFVENGGTRLWKTSSDNTERKYFAVLAAETAAMNSASVELVAIVACSLDL
jgi:hypothetical protein